MTVVVALTCETCGYPLTEHPGPGWCPPKVPGCGHLVRDAREQAEGGCIACIALVSPWELATC